MCAHPRIVFRQIDGMRSGTMTRMDRRESLRASFDSSAESYEAARPDHPAELFDDLIVLAGLDAGLP